MSTITSKNSKSHNLSKSVISTAPLNHTALPLHQLRGELRVDSRVLAQHLGNQHESVVKLLRDYADDFKQLAIFRFEIGKPSHGNVGGRPEQYALLSEDQCYLLLTYSRNSATVRALKLKLVIAFREARENRTLTDTQYLPFYHALHDEVATLAQAAHASGSTTDERLFHVNINRLVNEVSGIRSGMRNRLTNGQRLFVTAIQAVVRNALYTSIKAGISHKAAYQEAKRAAVSFATVAGRLLGGI